MTSGNNFLDSASQYWCKGKPLEAGRLIFENLPKGVRPKWAASILESVVRRTGIRCAPIENILYVARHPSEWKKAHAAFSSARRLTLELNNLETRDPEQTLLLQHLGLAELVAKVIYNATNPADEFDADSGWWITVCLKNILDLLGDEEFSNSMWRVASMGATDDK